MTKPGNSLTYQTEFQELLSSYAPSTAATRTLKQTQLVLLVGPAVSGRNTIIRELMKTGEYHYIVSDTTRQPRANNGIMEENGREYWFRAETDVLADIRNGMFLEAAVIHGQQVSGISIKEIERALSAEQIAITEVEIAGAQTIMQHKPDTKVIFVVPPDFDTWMARMSARGVLPEDEVTRRMQSAAREFSAALTNDYYHIIVNDRLDDTVAQVHAWVRFDVADAAVQSRNRRTVEELYERVSHYITQ